MQVYVKATETCNLNCKHCFTSGSSGAKIFFNPNKTINFLHRLLRDANPHHLKVVFHGGEPMLAPVADLWSVYHSLKEEGRVSFSMTTNLVYALTQEKLDFIQTVCKDGMGASWDYDIRFANDRQKVVFEENSRVLTKIIDMTLMVSITHRLIQEKEPIEIIQYARDLGYKYILFERITENGNALLNAGIRPSNEDQDRWLKLMWDQSIQYKTYDHIGNLLLSEIAEAAANGVHGGNRCRDCEQKLLTINADGTIAGCPNSAPTDHWGHIDQDITSMLKSPRRLEVISCERNRDPRCYTCPAFELCNGDCHQLPWEGEICAAPKTIWKSILNGGESDYEYRKLILT